MTETEKKALALVNELGVYHYPSLDSASMSDVRTTLCRAIEQHEAYKREVSDAVEELAVCVYDDSSSIVRRYMGRFIIAKPDPLVEVWDHMIVTGNFGPLAFRAAIEARGGRIVWEGE